MTCPVIADFDPLGHAYQQDPHGVMRDIRANVGVFFSPVLNRYVISGSEDIESILLNPDDFSSANTVAPVTPLSEAAQARLAATFRRIPTLSNADGERHARMRRYVASVISARRQKSLRPRIEARVGELVAAMLGRTAVDFYAELAYPLPASTAFELLGFPTQDTAQIKAWVSDRQLITWGRPSPAKQLQIAANVATFSNYIEDVIRQRMAESRDDAISELVAMHRREPEALTLVDIANIVFLLAAGAHETTTALLVHCVRRLLENPAQWDLICDDPLLIPDAVEEALRYDASQFAWSRVALRDTQVGGVGIPAGAELYIVLGSANHDETVFPDPATFDIRRDRGRHHLSFGKGIHFCIGAPLARLQAEIMLSTLARQAPELSLHPDQAFPYELNLATRSPKQLLLDVPAAGGTR
jgi:cytochrome P450